jgi:hypothetical protein
VAASGESETFERRFMDSVGKPIEFEGELVHAIYRRELEPGTLIAVEFARARERPAQGLELRVDDGLLRRRESGERGRSLRLWASEQREARLEYSVKAPTRLHVWNVWLDERGEEPAAEAWRAWSGMRLEEEGDGVLLRCSGNPEAPSFDDLVVRLRFGSA